MSSKRLVALAFLFCAVVASHALAQNMNFNFDIPTIPYPPQISDVSNSAAAQGAASFTVTVSIAGQMQMKGYCDIVPREDCTANDWYLAADTEIVPNPPTIQSVKLYYYKNDNVSGALSVDMTYDAALGKYKADVPLSGIVQGDTLTYYIVAVDSRGNVASQTPDTKQRPCTSILSWDNTLATPVTDSCSYASSYTRCNKYVSGTPSPCSSSYTVEDPSGDVCGEPGLGSCGDEQCIISGANADKVDITGMSVGADETYFCANIGLKAPPPSATDKAPIEAYYITIFDPDAFVPNPGDTSFPNNAYTIAFVPEAAVSGFTPVKAMWNWGCVTNSNEVCNLISDVGDNDLKIGYGGDSLNFMLRKSSRGSLEHMWLDAYSILENESKQIVIIGGTVKFKSAVTTYWGADVTPAFAFYQKNQTVVPCIECDSNKDAYTSCKPVMVNPIDFSSVHCAPEWNKADDDCSLTYNLYRCEGSETDCSTKAKFGTAIKTGITEAAGLSYADYDIITDHAYQYCVTAVDPSGNESRVIEASGNLNCESCTPGGEPKPVTGVVANALKAENNTGVNLYWDKYTMDDGGGGYYVYRCLGHTCANRGMAVKSCITTLPTETSPLTIDREPIGDWYYGVTYRKDCGDGLTESNFDTGTGGSIGGPVKIDPAPTCARCIIISSCADYGVKINCKPITQKFNSTAGFKVELLDQNNNSLGLTTLDADGNYKLVIPNDNSAVNLSYVYKVVVIVPEARKQSIPCSPGFTGNDCTILLDTAANLKDDGTVRTTQKLDFPIPGAGRAEIGNPDCNTSIDVSDLLIFKNSFGGNAGDSKYKTYADFDGNGRVDVDDFLILKKNFGKSLEPTPTFDATLCKPK